MRGDLQSSHEDIIFQSQERIKGKVFDLDLIIKEKINVVVFFFYHVVKCMMQKF